MSDSSRWCETCKVHGDHHTDRHDEMFEAALKETQEQYREALDELSKPSGVPASKNSFRRSTGSL